ncbi:hypothetical protein [Streptomyces sp. NPDC002044]|uniref:hypothetical protein n=1 Tax=Streptomyces sp. NPDC002044 TaxID=3154662 RepID=UPI003322B2E2
MVTPEYGREPARRGSPAPADVWRTPGGRIPLLREVTPGRAGVHPAEGPGGPPAYVPRDAEALLRAALAAPGTRFVLVVGEARAGATRLAYEVVRAVHPRYAFVRPLSRAALPEAVRVAARRRRAVLWLDGLEDHLGAGGLTAAHLDGLRGAVVVATMRAEEYRRRQAREASRLTGCDRGAWRAEHELLGRAAVVPVARSWSPRERRRVAALEAGEGRGPAEVLTGGEGPVARWTGGWTPGAQPAGAAVVGAAVDCRRAGLRRPVARAWLRALYPAYLAGRDGGETFGPALEWACAAVHDAGAEGLLAGNDVLGYTADGCLLDAPGLGPVPEHLWQGLLARAGPGDAYDLGIVARQEGRPARAVRALTAARRGGVAEAELPLALAVGDTGRPRRAAADLAALTRRRELRLGPRHPDTLAARHQLAFFTGEAGDPRAAARQLARLLADAVPVLGADHPGVLAVRRGLIWYRPAEPAGAGREWAALLADTEGRLGPDDPHTLAVRAGQAALAAMTGRTAEAVRAWAALTADRARVLGTDHPHVVHSRLEWARALIADGRRREAAELLSVVAQAGRFLEPGHRHLRLARELRAGLTAAAPEPP